MQIRWESEAIADLNSLRKYIAQENPSSVQKLAERIIKVVNCLFEQPLLGHPGRIHKTRELVVPGTPYTIIYHASHELIIILRVFHQARQWPDLLNKE